MLTTLLDNFSFIQTCLAHRGTKMYELYMAADEKRTENFLAHALVEELSN